MKRMLLGLLAVGLAGPMWADAQTTLEYQGTVLTGFDDLTTPDGSVQHSNLTIGPLAGALVLSGPLAANALNQLVTPVSWNFDSFGSVIPFDSSFFALAHSGAVENTSFSFSTLNGAIIDWSLNLSFGPQFGTNTTGIWRIQSFGPGASGQDLWSSDVGGPSFSDTQRATSVSGSRGWTVQAPELDASPALSAATFLLGCLAVVRGRRSAK